MTDLIDEDEDDEIDPLVEAGFRCSGLVAHPESWINRRVETIELLSQEETRRRVSVDFSLPVDSDFWPLTPEGLAVPISVLTKQRRRNFDLRDESGNAVPVLGRGQNSVMAHAAILGAALNLMDPENTPDEVFESVAERLWGVVIEPPEVALEFAGAILHEFESGNSWLEPLFQDGRFIRLLGLLVDGYILFAIVSDTGPVRRILKFSYGEDFDFGQGGTPPWWTRDGIGLRWQVPDGHRFLIECEMASWAESFHLEVAIPEELRAREATLFCEDDTGDLFPVGDPEQAVNRVSLHVPLAAGEPEIAGAYVELVPERAGHISQGLAVGALVASTLLAGASIGLVQGASDAAVSILLVGAAIFSGVSATSGKHFLVSKIFTGARHATLAIAVAALLGALSLTLDVGPDTRCWIWFIAGLASLVVTLRLALSAVRAAR